MHHITSHSHRIASHRITYHVIPTINLVSTMMLYLVQVGEYRFVRSNDCDCDAVFHIDATESKWNNADSENRFALGQEGRAPGQGKPYSLCRVCDVVSRQCGSADYGRPCGRGVRRNVRDRIYGEGISYLCQVYTSFTLITVSSQQGKCCFVNCEPTHECSPNTFHLTLKYF